MRHLSPPLELTRINSGTIQTPGTLPDLVDLFRTPEAAPEPNPFDSGEATFESSLPRKPARKRPSKTKGKRSSGPISFDEVPDLQSQSSGEEDGDGVFAALEPSLYKHAPPASSVSASASELLFEDLSEKTRLLKIAEKQAGDYKKKCEALSAELASAKKRNRDAAQIDANPISDTEAEVPRKKRSPPESSAASIPAAPPSRPTSKKRPSRKKLASRAGTISGGKTTDNSDDDVPAPGIPARPTPAKGREFEMLHSVLCAYKDDSNTEMVPGSPDLPYELCAELCRDEVDAISRWSKAEKSRFHPAIISALHLVYKNKKPEWFKSKFLSSQDQTAKYWSQVLTRRSEIWDAAAARASAVLANAAIATISLKERIRQKIKERKQGKIAELKVSAPSAGKRSSKGAGAAPVSCPGSSSSSDSEVAPPDVVDLSQSPGVPTCTDRPAAAAAPAEKLAPPPDSYTKVEIKTFARIAASIRDVDERRGFAPATIDFIDREFSDATGRLAKASKSRDPWKQKRLDIACSMAAKIMEDRYANMLAIIHASTPSNGQQQCLQRAPVQKRGRNR